MCKRVEVGKHFTSKKRTRDQFLEYIYIVVVFISNSLFFMENFSILSVYFRKFFRNMPIRPGVHTANNVFAQRIILNI